MATPFDVDGPHFAWREAGVGSPVALLHGLGGSRLSWEPQLGELSATHRVVAWDLPGYGQSAPLAEPYTFAALARAVVDFLDGIGEQTVHLAGISFGGMIAQYVAARYPDRVRTLSLLATSPAFGLDGTRPEEWRAARLAALDAGQEPADFAEHVLGSIAGPHISAEAMLQQRAAMARITGAALRRSIDCLVTHDSRRLLPSIAATTLCVVGDLDEETPVSYASTLAELIPGARLAVVPGAGHLVNVEAPSAVNQLLLDHMEQR
jgi:3-oxoadipate enol-lactonase